LLSRIDAEDQCSSIAPLMKHYLSSIFGIAFRFPQCLHLYETLKLIVPHFSQIHAISCFPPLKRLNITDYININYNSFINILFEFNIFQYFVFGRINE
jgi:hypothetical protein